MTSFASSRFLIFLAGTGLAVGAAILFWFDPSLYGFYPVCLFYKATGLLCPGCGSLRSLHQLLNGHLSAAFHFNPLLILSLPCCVWFGVLSATRAIKREPRRAVVSIRWVWLLAGIVLAVSVWRNLPGSPFAMLPR
jgi:hypothetical protein